MAESGGTRFGSLVGELRRQSEVHVFRDAVQGLNLDLKATFEFPDELLHQKLRRRGAGGYAHSPRAMQPLELQIAGTVDQVIPTLRCFDSPWL